MAHCITEPCRGVKAARCVAVCPTDAIHPRPDEPAFARVPMLHIDPARCIDCGLCVDECPVRAIYPAERVPAVWRHHVRRNAEWFASG